MGIDISSELIIHECYKNETTTKQKITLTSLSFKDGGSGLRDAWIDIDKKGVYVDHRVFIAYYRNKIVGWALCCEEDREEMRYTFMVYVNRKYRRMKIGYTLFKNAKRFAKRRRKELVVYRFENPNFFSYCGI